jgi:hypothetical protein
LRLQKLELVEHHKRRRYARAACGAKHRRFPKRDPAIEAMYPGHLLPTSPQMLEELLRRSLALEQSVIRGFVLGPRGRTLEDTRAA